MKKINEIEEIALGVDVYPVSVYNPDSISDILDTYLYSRKTISFYNK
ncbi:MAG: hypothetical protein U9Q80_01130 [Bacillota bacterium]|nr:hypothetical protein [Bacillota bacterium]